MATYTPNIDLKKPAQSDKIRIADLNGNADNIDAALGADFGVSNKPSVDDAVNSLGAGLAIISNGDIHAAITAGQYVYVRGHGTLTEGLYVATANVSQNGALTGNNVDAVSGGGLNALNSKITNLGGVLNFSNYVDPGITIINGTGTISKTVRVKYNSEYLMIVGTVRIPDFVRTGDNPGIKIQLPISISSNINLGACAIQTKNKTEFVNCNISSNYMTLIVTESYTNLGNGVVMFFIPQTIVKYA